MTVRQQIEALIHEGMRNCEIHRQLQCDPAYIVKVRSVVGVANKTAYAQRLPKLIELVAQGLSDDQIALHFGVSVESVRKMRNAGNVRRVKLHAKHSEIVALIRQKNKRVYISAVTGVPESTIAKIWAKQQMLDKNTGTKTASAGTVSQQVDMMTTTDLQSDRPSDSVSSM